MKKFLQLLTLVLIIGTMFSCGKDKSSLNDVSNFTISVPGVEPSAITYDLTGENITITVPYGTDLSSVATSILVSDKATVNPTSGSTLSFVDGVAQQFVVTAEDGSTKTYNVTVVIGKEMGTGAQLSLYEWSIPSFGWKIATSFEYNASNFLTKQTIEDSFDGTSVYEYVYNTDNQVITENGVKYDGTVSQLNYEYADNGVLVSGENIVNDTLRYVYAFEYDANGYLSKVVATGQAEGSNDFEVGYTIENGNVLEERYPSDTYTAEYDDKNNPFYNLYPTAYKRSVQNIWYDGITKNNMINGNIVAPGTIYTYNSEGYPTSGKSYIFSTYEVNMAYKYR